MIPSEFLNIFAAFGLSAAAGFNAWATLFIVSLAARFGFLTLAAPYDIMATDPVVIGLFILMVVEGLADKVPVLDHASHLIHTVLQPAAGAILFASQSSVITDVSPYLAFFVGALVAGSIHGIRAAFRPVVTISTVGHGNVVVSTVEDIVAVMLTAGFILAPAYMILVMIASMMLIIWLWRSRSSRLPGHVEVGEG